MTLTTLIIQLILTIPLTLIINYLSKKDNNTLHKIIIPTVYTLVVTALIPSIKENIFLIVVFEIFIRNFYISNFSHKANNIFKFILESLLSVALSLFTYNEFISKTNNVLPTPETIKPFLWFLIIVYIFNLCKPQINKLNNYIPKKKDIDKENIIMQYAKYKNKYGKIIKNKSMIINNLIYAIIIYNESTTPYIIRKSQELKGMFTTSEVPYGIMRINSKQKLTDEESIKETINIFETKTKDNKLNEDKKINLLLDNYYEENKR